MKSRTTATSGSATAGNSNVAEHAAATLDELRVYAHFARARGWPDGSARVAKRPPPEPDLLVTEPDGSVVAVEVVEIRDEDSGAMVASAIGTKLALERYLNSVPRPARDAFEQLFGDALLHFRFANGSTQRQRRSALPAAFRMLAALPPGYEGEARTDPSGVGRVLRSVNVSRGGFVGPCFDAESVARLGDPTVERIRAKIAKVYSTEHPIELLAYIDGQPMLPTEAWQFNLRSYLETRPGPCPFRRLWVLDVRAGVIRFYWPDDGAGGSKHGN